MSTVCTAYWVFLSMWNPVEDIYLFGGRSTNEDGTFTTSNEIHKLSLGKWDPAVKMSDRVLNYYNESDIIFDIMSMQPRWSGRFLCMLGFLQPIVMDTLPLFSTVTSVCHWTTVKCLVSIMVSSFELYVFLVCVCCAAVCIWWKEWRAGV